MQNTITDARGKKVFTDNAPRRIVSLVPSWTESLFGLGVGERVVGITDYCVEPKSGVAAIPKVGGTKNPRIEEILALQPDLVIANVEENQRRDIEWLESRGARCFVTFARTVRQAIDELMMLGELVGAGNIRAVVESIQIEYQNAIQNQNTAPCPRVFVAIWKDPWMTANGDTFINDMIELSGGANIFRERARRFPLAADLGQGDAGKIIGERDTRYPRVSIVEIAEHAPEILLLPDEPYSFTDTDVGELKAVRNLSGARVILLDGKVLTWYGVRMGESLKILRELIRGN
jgi:ABC-type Fe3+-hydroxamate transport system substrate-binding protein